MGSPVREKLSGRSLGESLEGKSSLVDETVLRKIFLFFLLLTCLVGSSGTAEAQRKSFRKSTDDDEEVIKSKLFPKRGSLEISGLDGGTILNQAYVQSFVFHSGINYYFREDWGIGIDALLSFNQDKTERYVIEHFYNDPNQEVGVVPTPDIAPVAPLKKPDGTFLPKSNFGPAYVGIRELSSIISAAAVWSPIYGKQLAFMSQTIYFDAFLTMGLGIALSNYYPASLFLANGNKSRINPVDKPKLQAMTSCDTAVLGGVCPSDPKALNYVGAAGRPTPSADTTPTITLGVGQKFHFLSNFHLKAEIRNYTLLGTQSGFDSIFAIWAGLGVRF